MKRTNIAILLVSVLTILIAMICCSHNKDTQSENSQAEIIDKPLPLNVSVYIDLSDRLTRSLTPSQMDRDTAIINHLIDIFIEDCRLNGKIVKSNNHFQVFFYPSPNNSQIALLAKGLNVDLSKTEIKQKKVVLKEMKERFQTNLAQIYEDALTQGKWVGSDIWGFFSNCEVDKLCIRNGYRNILVILTDGYLYHAENKIKEGNAYSYILPQTLENPDASLIVKRKGLSDLEVLILEVNPYNLNQRNALVSTLENWLNDMEISKYVVSKTDLPVYTENYIDNFIKE